MQLSFMTSKLEKNLEDNDQQIRVCNDSHCTKKTTEHPWKVNLHVASFNLDPELIQAKLQPCSDLATGNFKLKHVDCYDCF